MKWNKQSEHDRIELEYFLYGFHVEMIHIKNRSELLNWYDKYLEIGRCYGMGLSKFNFFNRKEGEKYEYEYEYAYEYEYEDDDDYDYDYEDDSYDDEYVEEEIITKVVPKKTRSKKKEKKSYPKLKKQDVKIEEKLIVVEEENPEDENERLREIISEQSEYINQLMVIKKKTDKALEQMTRYTQSLKLENEDLTKQIDTQKELIEVVDAKQMIETELAVKELALANEEVMVLREALQGNQKLMKDYQAEIENLTILVNELKNQQHFDFSIKEYDDTDVELETSEEAELVNYLEENQRLTEVMQRRLDSVEDELKEFKSKTKRKKRSQAGE
ncbi:hypothetical protein [Vagococcus jeotgali]|uniref:hypothetical protein n=1 Tax=Vagococcus jeotgali TaxID=3109030 RepID=UPI002DD964A7|nr:hypothetical protein [Vagococcus sp. B2T-5]